MPSLTFWFDLASSYSYLSAMRIEGLAAHSGVEITWRPFLLGPIFRRQGWETSPFNIYPAKGRYMVRDMQRIAASRQLPFCMPAVFPANSLLAARVALVGAEQGWIAPFVRGAFAAEFGKGADIAAHSVIADLLLELGLEPQSVLARAASEDIKLFLKKNTDHAEHNGIFGAPTFSCDDRELFWGDDRLEAAIAWAAKL